MFHLRGYEWQADGTCATHDDPDLWFTPSRWEEASAICFGGCPVAGICLLTAKERGETWGTWGGINFERPSLSREVA